MVDPWTTTLGVCILFVLCAGSPNGQLDLNSSLTGLVATTEIEGIGNFRVEVGTSKEVFTGGVQMVEDKLNKVFCLNDQQ